MSPVFRMDTPFRKAPFVDTAATFAALVELRAVNPLGALVQA